jgi:CubicO group peptidase (beta-lactamase class C family)
VDFSYDFKAGTAVAATIDDRWHLGSDTKAMTAVVMATFVERGRRTWDTTLGDVFAELASGFPSEFRAITVTQLLSHYAGLPANLQATDEAVAAMIVRQEKR